MVCSTVHSHVACIGVKAYCSRWCSAPRLEALLPVAGSTPCQHSELSAPLGLFFAFSMLMHGMSSQSQFDAHWQLSEALACAAVTPLLQEPVTPGWMLPRQTFAACRMMSASLEHNLVLRLL